MAMTLDTKLTSHPLSEEQIGFYRTEGYLVVRSVFSADEVKLLGNDATRVLQERQKTIHPDNLRVRFKNNIETNEPVLEVFDPISDLSSVAKSMTVDPRILDRLHSIYGEQACLFKDKLIYKPPGAVGASLHQDWIGWPGFPESFLTVLIAVDPFDLTSGATAVYPRLHANGYMSPKDGQHHLLNHDDMGIQPVTLVLQPGDVAIFSCFTPHYSESNESEHWRRGYFISYNAFSDGGEQFDRHYTEFHDWIRSRYPAERRSQLVFQ